MKRNIQSSLRDLVLAMLAAAVILLAGCNRRSFDKKEYVYVAAPQVRMRDRLATIYNTVANPKNGERLEVLDRQKKFVKVKDPNGQEGWVEQRYVVSEDVFNKFEQLSRDHSKVPAQATGMTRAAVNMHITPERDSDKLYQLAQDEKVDVLERAVAEKPDTPTPVTSRTKSADALVTKPMEDWWLVRSQHGKVGWVLSRMIYLDVPLEVAQYAEGDRIMACFVIDEVEDPQQGKKVPQYLMLLSDSKEGQPFDYNQARVFTWNLKRHRYETAYRERGLYGKFPVTIGKETFGTEGTLPTFTLRVLGEKGNTLERKYKLNQPIVRRVADANQQEPMAKLPGLNEKKRR